MNVALIDAEVDGARSDVFIVDGVVASVGPVGSRQSAATDLLIDAGGGALMVGMHDHHIHLVAAAAARSSVSVGPPDVTTFDQFAAVVSAASADGWVRAVGYHESVAGPLDRDLLDRLRPDAPLRVQHRSGAAWFVNSAALVALGIGPAAGPMEPPGVERDVAGRPTGRLFRLDDWLRDRWPATMPDLAAVGDELAAAGVVGCTDATPWSSAADLAAFGAAAASLPQRVWAMATSDVAAVTPELVVAVKIVLGDDELPDLDDLVAAFARSHRARLPVAVHSVTPESLALAIAGWRAIGVLDGDRVEHAAMASTGAVDVLVELGVRVVTQPGFVFARGDTYLDEVAAADHADLWRCGSLLRAGLRVAAGSDAPHGPLDPWTAIRASTDRLSTSGRMVGAGERISPLAALDLYRSAAGDPGGAPRRVVAGAAADLVLLDRPLSEVLAGPSRECVVATFVAGEPVYSR